MLVQKTMKLLEITINRDNKMHIDLSNTMKKIQMTYNKIRSQLEYMGPNTKQIIIEAKVQGQINSFLPSIINRNKTRGTKGWPKKPMKGKV